MPTILISYSVGIAHHGPGMMKQQNVRFDHRGIHVYGIIKLPDLKRYGRVWGR